MIHQKWCIVQQATLDQKTSEICRDMDGQHFKVEEYEVGITAPPFHPNCRTCTVPYFDDEFTEDEKRASRNSEGKTETTVPADMTYREWEKEYLKAPEELSKTLRGDFDDIGMISNDSNIKPEVSKAIEDTVHRLEKENGVRFNYVSNQLLNGTDNVTYFETQTVTYGNGNVLLQLNFNPNTLGGKTLEEINQAFASHNSTVANNLEEALQHEMEHAKLWQGRTRAEIDALEEELKPQFFKGISGLASQDGNEAIAEIGVKLKRGDILSEKEIEFYNKYRR